MNIEYAVKRIRQLKQPIKELEDETVVLAKLAATGRAFFNPLEAFAAESIRDRILRDKCRLNPDGTFIKRGDAS
jgi:hypothetical protein